MNRPSEPEVYFTDRLLLFVNSIFYFLIVREYLMSALQMRHPEGTQPKACHPEVILSVLKKSASPLSHPESP